ncbi:MAG: hypothetical protein V4659_13610 [Pseudomonadota bacterium]
MDAQRQHLAERRAALAERRIAALRVENTARVRAWLAPLLTALEGAGDAYALLGLKQVPGWTPDWIPWGWSEVPWQLAPPERFPAWRDDRTAHAPAATAFLAEVADPAVPVLMIWREDNMIVRLSRDAAVKHLSAALAVDIGYGDFWLRAPPDDWLIRFENDGGLTLYDAPVADVAAAHRARRAGRAVLRPALAKLVAAGLRYRLEPGSDPRFARYPGPGPRRPRIAGAAMTLDHDLRADPAGRDPAAMGFVADRASGSGWLRLTTARGSDSTAWLPTVRFRRESFLARPGAVLDAFAPPFWIAPPDEAWVLDVGPVRMRGRG